MVDPRACQRAGRAAVAKLMIREYVKVVPCPTIDELVECLTSHGKSKFTAYHAVEALRRSLLLIEVDGRLCVNWSKFDSHHWL